MCTGWNGEQLGWRLNIKAINESLHAIFEGVNVSGEYDGPALFIRGGLSQYVSDDDIVLIRKKFPGAVVKTIAQCFALGPRRRPRGILRDRQ